MDREISNEQLLKKVEYLQDEYIKMKKMYEDLLYNLDYDNFGVVVNKDMDYFMQTFREVFPDGTETMSSIYQTASEIMFKVSESIDGVTNKISVVSQTADKINWLVASGTNSSNFTLTDRMASLMADKINMTGYVTFASLESNDVTTINGPDITGGNITGAHIQGGTLASMGNVGHVQIQNTAMLFFAGNTPQGSINFNNGVMQVGATDVLQIVAPTIVLNYTNAAYLRYGLGVSYPIASTQYVNSAIAAHVSAYH